MSTQIVKIIDPCQQVVATAQVAKRGARFAGVIDLSPMPASLRQKFEAYEEIVNGQIFSLLDEIEEQIRSLPLKVVFNEGAETAVEDLQIYPSTRRVSFKIMKAPAQGATQA
jgi:hypothetical protein